MPHIILTLPTTNTADEITLALDCFKRNVNGRMITTSFNVDAGLIVMTDSPDGIEIERAATLLAEELTNAYIESEIHYRIEEDKVSKYHLFEN